MKKPIRVTCAIIQASGKILTVQRSTSMHLPGKWEFPGGKVEPGETEEACILREIREELNIEIHLGHRLPSVVHHYPDFSIELIPFLATHRAGDIRLAEHSRYLFLAPGELASLDWAEADLPILNMLDT